jgi:dCMP deaminase
MTRPSWDEYFMRIAWLVKDRSHDLETKHGTVIVLENRIVGTGYNGWPPDMDLNEEYAKRPAKYSCMFHSEENALSYCVTPEGGTLYTTGKPCLKCLGLIVKNKIKRLVILDRQGWKLETEETDRVFHKTLRDKEVELTILPISTLDES